MILAILSEISEKFASFSLKIKKNTENCHLQSLPFTQILKCEIMFKLNLH